jgi:hypothetical protein
MSEIVIVERWTTLYNATQDRMATTQGMVVPRETVQQLIEELSAAERALGETLDDLDQAMRQWVMYAEDRDERDLRTDNDAEARMYRDIAIRRGKNDDVLNSRAVLKDPA